MRKNVNFPDPIDVVDNLHNCIQNIDGTCRYGKRNCCYECVKRVECAYACRMKDNGISPETCGFAVKVDIKW